MAWFKKLYLDHILILIAILGLAQFILTRPGIASPIFPTPLVILERMIHFPKIWVHALSSIIRLFVSVITGFILGVLIAVVIRAFKKLSFFEDAISFFMSIPGISWAPIFIILLGFGDRVILLVAVITAIFPAAYYTWHGLLALDLHQKQLTDLMGYNTVQRYIQFVFPAMANYLVIGFKLSFARTWRTIIAIEMICATTSGLGYMAMDARELLNIRDLYCGILLSGLTFLVIDKIVFSTLEHYTVRRWGMKVK